jgi:hypothetical protein
MAPGHDEDDRRERQFTVFEDERFDVPGDMVDGDERHTAGPGKRFRE